MQEQEEGIDMGVIAAPLQRTWRVMRKPFDHVPVRGLFYFVNGNPSGVYVKISPTTCALPAQAHLNNPHFLYKTVLPRGTGNLPFAGSGSSDFAYFQGNTISVSRSANVIEVNPSMVSLESDKRDW